jgi:subtilisin
MKKKALFSMLVAFTLLFGLVLPVSAAGITVPQDSNSPMLTPNGNDQGRYIVVFHDSVDPDSASSELGKEHGIGVGHIYRYALKGFSGFVPAGRLAALKADHRVKLVEPDLKAHIAEQTLPTGVDRIDADLNATAKIDGIDERVDVDIAIIDTGIDRDHPDLNVVNGRRFYSVFFGLIQRQDDKYDDDNGHGSHCAGIAAAIDNDYGVVGVAPGARLWAIKVLDASGSGYVSDIVAGIDWVTQHASEIEVANMSLRWIGNVASARLAIMNSILAGVVYVAAAGNESIDVYGTDGIFGTGDDIEPAAYPEVATISAMADSDGQPGGTGGSTSYGTDDSFASFSNFSTSEMISNPVNSPGAAIDLMMPGVNIYSTYKNGGYTSMSGTSMASPHAAGLAALYIAVNGRPTNAISVCLLRQALVDNGVAQDSSQGLTTPNDPDNNKENIGWAGPSGPPNSPPVANNDSATTSEETAVGIDVTANDTDVDGTIDKTTVTITAGSSNGLTSIDPVTGVVTYTPNTDFNGTDNFKYTVNDNLGAISNEANVSVTVTGINDPPVANNDNASVGQGGTVSIDVLNNDTDPDSTLDYSNVTITAAPSNGSATVGVSGISYTHDGSETTTDSFTYQVCDGGTPKLCDTATVTITIEPTSPTAPLDITNTSLPDGTVNEAYSATVEATGGTLPYSWAITAGVLPSGLSLDPATGEISGTPTTEETQTFTVTVTDDTAATDSQALSITVNAASATMHVGDLDGTSNLKGKSGKWSAIVMVTVHDSNHAAVSNATVSVSWSTGKTASGTTDSNGQVSFDSGVSNGGSTSITLTVENVTHATLTYDKANHDPDGDSDGTSITVSK